MLGESFGCGLEVCLIGVEYDRFFIVVLLLGLKRPYIDPVLDVVMLGIDENPNALRPGGVADSI